MYVGGVGELCVVSSVNIAVAPVESEFLVGCRFWIFGFVVPGGVELGLLDI
jgi:hypothetical protein